MVTAEQARAELARRRALRAPEAASATPQGVTPEEARAELARRRAAATSPSVNTTFTNAFGDVLSFGLMDEAVAGAAALLRRPFTDRSIGDLYREGMSRQRGLMEADERVNPGTRLAGQIAGGVFAGARAAPLTLSSRAAASGAPLLSRMGAGAVDAGVAGAAYGAGSADGDQTRLEGAAGGLLAVPFGAAFPLLGAGASAAYRNVRNALTAKPLARSAGANLETLRTIGSVIEADDLAGAGRANMARAGREAMLVDAGPTAQSVLDTAIQRGGPGARVARERIQGRVARDSRALTAALDDTLGRPGESQGRDLIVYGDRTNPLTLLYRRAYESPIDYATDAGMRIEDAVRNRVPAAAIRAANELMRVEGHQSRQIAARIADDGTVTFERLPDVRQLDYITRGLNEVAEQADGKGKLGGTTATGRAYANLAREIRNDLKDLVPAYKQALDRASTQIAERRAREFGRQMLSPSVSRDEVAEFTADMPLSERRRLAEGVRSQIDDLMARVTRTIGDDDMAAREAIAALRNLSSRANREKLAVALGEERVAPMLQEIDRAAQSFNIRAALTGNSRTYGRQATAQMVQDMSAPGAVGTLMRGEPVNASKRIVQALTGQTDDVLRARQDAIYSEIADLLTRPGGPDQSVFQAVQGLNQTDALTRAVADRLNRGLSSPLLSYPAATQSIEGRR